MPKINIQQTEGASLAISCINRKHRRIHQRIAASSIFPIHKIDLPVFCQQKIIINCIDVAETERTRTKMPKRRQAKYGLPHDGIVIMFGRPCPEVFIKSNFLQNIERLVVWQGKFVEPPKFLHACLHFWHILGTAVMHARQKFADLVSTCRRNCNHMFCDARRCNRLIRCNFFLPIDQFLWTGTIQTEHIPSAIQFQIIRIIRHALLQGSNDLVMQMLMKILPNDISYPRHPCCFQNFLHFIIIATTICKSRLPALIFYDCS